MIANHSAKNVPLRRLLFLLLLVPLQAQDLKQLDAVMNEARKEAEIPAIGSVAFDTDKILQISVVGTTRSDNDISVKEDSAWHIGSDGKAMTATLMAILVEKKLLTWETTMAEIFPKLADTFHPEAKKITITQLLSHTAGLPANPAPRDRLRSRLSATKIGLTLKPTERFLYSNYGYVISGAVIEKLLNTTWERAISRHLFQPLGMKSAGFGAPNGRKPIHGHIKGSPIPPGQYADNPPQFGPAGRIHLTLSDWALFCQDQIKGHHGNGKLLKQANYQKLHTPVSKNYALGWGVNSRWGKITHLRHDGSNKMWYARAILDLTQKTGCCITLNSAEPKAVEWITKIAEALQPEAK